MAGDGSTIKEMSVVYKATTTDLANDATVNNDVDLAYAVAINEKIIIRTVLLLSAGAGGFKCTFNGPAGFSAISYKSIIVVSGNNPIVSGSAAAWGNEAAFPGAIGDGVAYQELYLVNGANAGNIYSQWAQQAANANNTSVLLGSRMDIVRL